MNRRNFIGNLLAATAGFTILPSAGRIWKATRQVETEINLAWGMERVWIYANYPLALQSKYCFTVNSLGGPEKIVTDLVRLL